MSKELSVVKANNSFSTTLLKSIERDDENILISPLSAHVVLSMVYQGAGGKTAANMAQVFDLLNPEKIATEYNKIMKDLNSVKSVTLNVANKIYVMDKCAIEPAFKNTIVTSFLSEVDNINFANSANAANTINKWVENKTNKKILKLMDDSSVNSLTRVILLNAVYFKGSWAKKFDPKLTEPKPFYPLNEEEIMVNMMHKYKYMYKYNENKDLDCKILEIPYKGQEFSMIVFLPNRRNDILDLQNKLTTSDTNKVINRLSEVIVTVQLPKFIIESTISLKEAFYKMGADHMFSNDADLSNMSKADLFISDFVQKTFMEVNEEGTEAAVVCYGGITLKSMPKKSPPEMKFIVDHPFVVALIHKGAHANSILFLARVMKP